jgi:large subunit ribosomal protein L10
MRKDKIYLLGEIAEPLAQHPHFILMKYERVPANSINQFRRKVASTGGTVKVMSKTILSKACQSKGIPLNGEQFEGHIAIIFGGKDPLETFKTAFDFSKETEEATKVVGGHIEGKLYSGEEVERLSKLPSKQEMRAQLLGVFEAPMADTLAVMNALLTSVVYCLDNKANAKA